MRSCILKSASLSSIPSYELLYLLLFNTLWCISFLVLCSGSSLTATQQSISDRIEQLVDALDQLQGEMAEAKEKQLIAEEELRQAQQNGQGGGGEHNTHRPSPRDGESKGGWGSAVLEAGLRQQLEQSNQIIKQMQEEQVGGVANYKLIVKLIL